MSTEPSLWSELFGSEPEPDVVEPTHELMRQHDLEAADARRADLLSEKLWEKYASRLTATGQIIR